MKIRNYNWIPVDENLYNFKLFPIQFPREMDLLYKGGAEDRSLLYKSFPPEDDGVRRNTESQTSLGIRCLNHTSNSDCDSAAR